MTMKDAQAIRRAYIDFFTSQDHTVIDRSPLVLTDDPTTLFTGSGMQPLMPYLLGETHPTGSNRLVDSQTCLRAQDIEDVGDNRHTTFFEMLGNWSLGDYFKEQQIRWFFSFLTDTVGLDPEKIYVTCFIGDEERGIPRDDEAADIWTKIFTERGIDAKIVELGAAENGDKLGMQGGRIFFYDDSENWWSRSGGINDTPIGDPCGPDSEVFYDFGNTNHDPSYGLAHPASDSGQFMEIGNQVFMQYRRLEDGSFEPLEKKNVDFGGGLERIAAAAINNPDVFQISLLRPIITKLEDLSGKKYASHTESMRVIADHLRAAVFLAVDGCKPSNKQQGYVMRRLLRRAIRFAFDLGVEQNFMEEVVPVIADLYTADYPEVKRLREEVIAILVKEEKAFRQTLRKGLKEFNKLFSDPTIDAGVALFTLYDTYGFPVELSSEEAFKQGIELPNDWRQRFEQSMQIQRERSQTAAKGAFKGGLEGDSLQHKKYHTATHLLQSALRQIFGDELRQHGSNITTERLRFDFNLDHKMTPEQKQQAEDLVNGWIKQDLPVSYQMYPTQQALDMGAIGPFGERYDDQVKVYQMGEADNIASLEICGGPHVDQTGQLGEDGATFKIKKEESSSAGIRRIKAVLVQD